MTKRTRKAEDKTAWVEYLTGRHAPKFFPAGLDETGEWCYAAWYVVEVETGEIIDGPFPTQTKAENAAEELNWVEEACLSDEERAAA